MLESFLELFNLFCRSYVEKLPSDIKRELGIEDTELFCSNAQLWFGRFAENFRTDRKSYNSQAVELGKRLYRKGLTIAFVIDAVNEVVFNALNFINTEKLPFSLSEEVVELTRELPNLLSLGFIYESIDDKEALINAFQIKELKESLAYHFGNLRDVISGRPLSKHKIENCPFLDYLNSIVFGVLCRKGDLCKETKSIHSNIHKLMGIFKGYFQMGKYLPAYITLLTVFHLLEKLSAVVSSVESNRKSIDFHDIVGFVLEDLKEEVLLVCFDPKEVAFVNKVYGYEIGDKVFTVIEEELKRELPAGSGILRCPVGTVCLISRKERLNVDELFEKVNSKLKSEFRYLPVNLSVSAFSVLFPKNCRIDVEEAVSLVDYAWKEAKRSERPLRFNLKDLKEKLPCLKIKESVETLISYLKKGRFKIAAQGIYNLKSGELEHYELLFRALGEGGRIVPAGEIIDLVYEYRVVHELDLAVLKKIVENRDKLPKGKIFINLSTATLKFPDARERLLSYFRLLKEHGIRFGIEITEQKILEDEAVVRDFFNSVDIPISIDDFGSGYASFSQFISLSSNLPVRFLKIDGSYVKLLSSQENVRKAVAVIRSINSMAHSLGMKTIAEFVENEEILTKLKELNVDYGQGYYLDKPKVIF